MLDRSLSIKLYQTISDANEERVFEHWHASSIGECPRTQYFKRLGIKGLPQNQASAALMLRWQSGHSIEEAIRRHLKTLFPDLVSNDRLTSKIMDLTGEEDNRSENIIIEIKSVDDGAFVQRDNEIFLKEEDGTKIYNGKEYKNYKPKLEPYLHHELQQHAYVLLEQERGRQIEEIVYTYISLRGRIVTYSTPVKQELLDNVKARLKVLNEAWKTQTPPECICKESHPLYAGVMRYCPYKTDNDCCSLNLIKGEE